MALIKREAFRSELLSLTYYGDGEYYSGREAEREAIIDRLNEQPTIDPIRAAGGCRCGECKWFGTAKTGGGWCNEVMARPMPYDGFCSYGEPREAQDDG